MTHLNGFKSMHFPEVPKDCFEVKYTHETQSRTQRINLNLI